MDKEYRDYLYHIKGSAVGMVLGLVVSLLVGVAVLVIGVFIS